MMLGDKEKSAGKTSINRTKSPYIPVSEFNKSEAQVGTRSSLCEQTLAGGGSSGHFRSCLWEVFKGPETGMENSWEHVASTSIPGSTQYFCVKCKLSQLSENQIALFFLVG